MERIEQLEEAVMAVLNEDFDSEDAAWEHKKSEKLRRIESSDWVMSNLAQYFYDKLAGFWTANVNEPVPAKLHKIWEEVFQFRRALYQYIGRDEEFDENAPFLSNEEARKRGLNGWGGVDTDVGPYPGQATDDFKTKDDQAYNACLYIVLKDVKEYFDGCIERIGDSQVKYFPENAGKKPLLLDRVWKIYNDIVAYEKETLNFFNGDEKVVWDIVKKVQSDRSKRRGIY